MPSTLVKAVCKCGLNTFQVVFDTTKIPRETSMCHCNSCRHLTGQLAYQCAMLEGAPLTVESTLESQKPADLSNLKAYKTSNESILTRYFCKTCGAHIIGSARIGSADYWAVSTGALERVEGIVKAGSHLWVGDTLDGGLADHLRVFDGVEVTRHAAGSGSPTLDAGWKAESIAKGTQSGTKDYLAAYCHCKAVSLHLTRVDEELTKNPANWWAVAKNADDPTSLPKFMSGHCLCNSCRLSSGTTINSWVILPAVNVLNAQTGQPVTYAPGSSGRIPGLQRYESSPQAFREACGTCGATVFLWYTDPKRGHLPPAVNGEPVVVCLSAGLLDQEDGGARVEGWCHWHDEVIHPEDAIDKAILEALKKGIKSSAASTKAE
ncbi:hypothetical protein CVT26_015303 [Gymnopilus dilepis]|uniref:CENP-V/GFA domain-containing protein n=1 Tax=Gymnopilus dilepis TaxID=231916 RepID=A0A409YE05_9AGAR|nr:hypothetical protein CVT26_015303 [Gymnopilus dilepis]